MSATPRLCCRCGILLRTTPGIASAQCPRCGTRYPLAGGEAKCLDRAPVPGVLVSGPPRPAVRPAAGGGQHYSAPRDPAMIRFACPQCKTVLQAPDRQAGTAVGCPFCKQKMQVPKPARATPPPRPPTPPSTPASVPANARLGVLMPNHGPHPPRNHPSRPSASRARGRSWLMPVSLIFLILILSLIGDVLLGSKSSSSTDGGSEATAKLAVATPAQATSPAPANESAAQTPNRPGVLDKADQPPKLTRPIKPALETKSPLPPVQVAEKEPTPGKKKPAPALPDQQRPPPQGEERPRQTEKPPLVKLPVHPTTVVKSAPVPATPVAPRSKEPDPPPAVKSPVPPTMVVKTAPVPATPGPKASLSTERRPPLKADAVVARAGSEIYQTAATVAH